MSITCTSLFQWLQANCAVPLQITQNILVLATHAGIRAIFSLLAKTIPFMKPAQSELCLITTAFVLLYYILTSFACPLTKEGGSIVWYHEEKQIATITWTGYAYQVSMHCAGCLEDKAPPVQSLLSVTGW